MKIKPGFVMRPFGPTMYKNTISDRFRDEILDASKISTEEANFRLAGNIDKEVSYKMSAETVDELEDFVTDYIKAQAKIGTYQPPDGTELSNIELEIPWINVQKKGEWNPPHIHSGDFSCIVYAQVPRELRDEWKHPTQRGRAPSGGKVEFFYGQWAPHNSIKLGPLEPEEKDIYIFPAWLQHHVYPFNADVERISLSTNFFLKFREKK